ncbi:hypothetical protein SNEBB_009411, partial [Seison nebaliae]
IDVDSEISNLDQKADKNLIEDDDWLREMPSLDRIDAIAIRDINGRKINRQIFSIVPHGKAEEAEEELLA